MDKAKPFTVRGRIRSFGYAQRGVRMLLRREHNAWLHLAATAGVVLGGLGARVGRWEWCMLILAMAAVWTAEAVNTALEHLCDVACPRVHEGIARMKDLAAGAVLLSALGAAVIGVIVFAPYVCR